MSAPKFDDLPPLARATAMALERPYRPGQSLRLILVGIVLVAAVAAAFLLRMPASEPRQRVAAPAAPAAPTPGVVYQNLRAAAKTAPAGEESAP